MSAINEAISEYVAEVAALARLSSSREHAYRPAQIRLFNAIAPVVTINDAAKSGGNMPDFVFLDAGNPDVPRGYGEAKDVGANLDKVEQTDQLVRYGAFENLLLTNALDFRFYRHGDFFRSIELGWLDSDGNVHGNPDVYSSFADEFNALVNREPAPIVSARRLSEIMAGKARRIRDMVRIILATDAPNDRGVEAIKDVFLLVRKMLVHDLQPDDFADMYAQTLVYGLFSARFQDDSPESFSRREAVELVSTTTPFLREFFDHIAGSRFDKRLAYPVDELCEVFRISNVRDIVHRHLNENGTPTFGKDPIVHFYENFLELYDKDQKTARGVFYTPTPLVRFVVRQVDELLKKEFGIAAGLADSTKRDVVLPAQPGKVRDQAGRRSIITQKQTVSMHRVQILDPAVGTATFLNETILHIQQAFENQKGRWPKYVTENLIPRLHGFELMMAPYTIAHMKLGMTLVDEGASVKDRLGVYLTNSLDRPVQLDHDLFTIGLADAFTKEANAASEIKTERPIMVVMGNPPWAGESANKSTYAKSLISKYKVEPGGHVKLDETNSKWLSDDYVKFMAFAEGLIERNGEGIVAFVTNNGYLDNPTFRGMRWHLAKTFDVIRVLDLHGSAGKKEKAPSGAPDKNVFDIKQGVAIILAVKTGAKSEGDLAELHVSDLFGTRVQKFTALENDAITWNRIELDPISMRFKEPHAGDRELYEEGIPITEIFMAKNVGFVTGRDHFDIDRSKTALWERMQKFVTMEVEDARANFNLRDDVQDWKVEWAQQDVQGAFSESNIVRVAYRPLDYRWAYYTGNTKGIQCRPRKDIAEHFRGHGNLGFAYARSQKDGTYSAVLAVDAPMDAKGAEASTQSYMAPLYLFREDGARDSNISPAARQKLTMQLKVEVTDEQLYDYMYGLLHDPNYRNDFGELLKSDFPKIRIPRSDDDFEDFSEFGNRLRELHLLRHPAVKQHGLTYPVAGSDEVKMYEPRGDRIYINDEQYFGNIPEDVWNFRLGGYEPARKWLKDRKGSVLSDDEIGHYQSLVNVLALTAKAMDERGATSPAA